MGKQIQNPSQAFGQTDISSNSYQEIAEFVANAACTAGDGVGTVWDETERTLKVTPADSDTSAYYGIGVALDTVAAGEIVRVVVYGFALANIGSDTPAAYENIILGSTAGTLVSQAAAETTVAGSILGFALGDEDGSTNLVPMWVSPR